VGAGASGLYLGSKLQERGHPVIVLEKSKGLGGRMATRRAEGTIFDHGAQFISFPEELIKWEQALEQEGIVKFWFQQEEKKRYFCPEGITQFAKTLGKELSIQKNSLVEGLRPHEGGGWWIYGAGFSEILAQHVVVTAPLPQAEKLLAQSHLSEIGLPHIPYHPALVIMIDGKCPIALPPSGYFPSPFAPLSCVVGMREKSVSSNDAHVVVFDSAWSRAHFEQTEEKILQAAKDQLLPLGWLEHKGQWTLKKWRYAEPEFSAPQMYYSPSSAPGLHFVGDAFGGGSIAGALRSAHSLFLQLTRDLPPPSYG
jgi:renalase